MHTEAPPHDTDPAGLPAAQALFQREGLPWPPVPRELLARLQPAGPSLFSTGPLDCGPYDLARHVLAFQADPSPVPQAVIGIDGHGFNSWALHCYIVHGGLALFIQLPWGGAFLDTQSARTEIADMLDWAAALQSRMDRASQAGVLPAGRWLQVVASRLSHAGWRWIDKDPAAAVPSWQPAAGMKAALLQEAEQLLRDRGGTQREPD